MGRAELETSLSTLDVWLIIFGVFVAIGVVGESVVGFLHWRRGNELQALQTAENLAQQKDIARLSAETATAEQHAAEANLALARFKAPRTLNAEQRKRIADEVKAFAGTTYDEGVGPINDPEPQFLLDAIGGVLREAGWRQIDWQTSEYIMGLRRVGQPVVGGVSVTNVIVEYPPDNKRLSEAATALAAALIAEGIAAGAIASDGLGGGGINTNPNTIHVMVGRKL